MTKSRDEIESWMHHYISELISEPLEQIELDTPFLEFDIDSIDSITMALEMEKALHIEVPTDIFLDGLTTIKEVAGYFDKK